MTHSISRLCLATLAAFPALPALAQAPQILAAYSLVIGNADDGAPVPAPDLLARVVVAGDSCDGLTLEGRASSGTPSAAPVLMPRQGPASRDWDVMVCQARLPGDWHSAAVTGDGQGLDLPGPHAVGRKHPGEVVVLGVGDTGCRDRSACAPGQMSFRQVAAAAVDQNPDIVFHVGDFRYIDENRPGSQTWENFYDDWFDMAAGLNRTAALVIARGNHEQCDGSDGRVWYSDGWSWLFGADDGAQSPSCRDAAGSAGPNHQQATWSVDVAPQDAADPASEAVRLVVVDTSADCNSWSRGCSQRRDWPHDDPNADVTRVRAAMVEGLGDALTLGDGFTGAGGVLWVTHKPVWDYAGGGGRFGGWTVEIADMLDEAAPGGLAGLCSNGACVPHSIVSGHQHYRQQIRFEGSGGDWIRPQQVIVGNGGVAERNVPGPAVCSNDFGGATGIVSSLGDPSDFSETAYHGFTLWTIATGAALAEQNCYFDPASSDPDTITCVTPQATAPRGQCN